MTNTGSNFQRGKKSETKPAPEQPAVAEDVTSVSENIISDIIDERPLLSTSPIQQKIDEVIDNGFVPPKGWNKMKDAPIDGTRIMVSENGKDTGALVYWRVSKYVDKKNLRYIPRGRWTDFVTHKDIEFVPHCWKAYNPEEYWPLRG